VYQENLLKRLHCIMNVFGRWPTRVSAGTPDYADRAFREFLQTLGRGHTSVVLADVATHVSASVVA
jgi:hypothetical protein